MTIPECCSDISAYAAPTDSLTHPRTPDGRLNFHPSCIHIVPVSLHTIAVNRSTISREIWGSVSCNRARLLICIKVICDGKELFHIFCNCRSGFECFKTFFEKVNLHEGRMKQVSKTWVSVFAYPYKKCPHYNLL